MTRTTTAPTPPSARKRSTGASIAAMIAGAVAAIIGFGLAVIGALLLGVFGSDGTVASGSHSLSSTRTAMVSSVADIHDVGDVADVVGDPRLDLSVSGPDVFVGIGPATAVDRYLAGAPIDEITDFEVDPFELTRQPRPGSAQPAPPESQEFWVAEGTGRDGATLEWPIDDGDYRLVVMNADGSRPVVAQGEVKLFLPHVSAIAWSLLGGGFLLLVLGSAGIVLAVRSRRSAAPAAPGAPA